MGFFRFIRSVLFLLGHVSAISLVLSVVFPTLVLLFPGLRNLPFDIPIPRFQVIPPPVFSAEVVEPVSGTKIKTEFELDKVGEATKKIGAGPLGLTDVLQMIIDSPPRTESRLEMPAPAAAKRPDVELSPIYKYAYAGVSIVSSLVEFIFSFLFVLMYLKTLCVVFFCKTDMERAENDLKFEKFMTGRLCWANKILSALLLFATPWYWLTVVSAFERTAPGFRYGFANSNAMLAGAVLYVAGVLIALVISYIVRWWIKKRMRRAD